MLFCPDGPCTSARYSRTKLRCDDAGPLGERISDHRNDVTPALAPRQLQDFECGPKARRAVRQLMTIHGRLFSLQSFSFSAVSVGTPARCPLSTSAFVTQSCSVCGVQPILAAIDVTAAHRDGCSPARSRTIRTARGRSGGAAATATGRRADDISAALRKIGKPRSPALPHRFDGSAIPTNAPRNSSSCRPTPRRSDRSSRAFSPPNAPLGMRPRASRSVSDPAKP